ncbi:MAG: hypothetical protein IJW21_01560, partial [Clostridia bacterium]|nr:hypothetical protein [Clostridia bacterium]
MADKYDENTRKKALASKYREERYKSLEAIRDSFGVEKYKFYENGARYMDTEIYAELKEAMKKPDTVPSEYVCDKLGWLFGELIPSREKEVISYFADRLQEYPYSDSYSRRSLRAKRNGAYLEKLVRIIRE